MAIYSATSLSPSNIAIIPSIINTFSWMPSGDSQTSYRLLIYRNDNNSLVYDSTKINSTSTTHSVPANTLTNNITYKFQVETWHDTNSAKSKWSIFFTNALPTLTIGILPTNVQTYNFYATYNSSSNISVKTYRAYLYDNTNNLIDDSGDLYPSTLITNNKIYHIFDGLESNTTYGIRFTCENQNGYKLDTGISTFSINYSYPPAVRNLIVTPNNEDGSITLDWLALKFILGKVDGTFSYVTGKFNQGLQLISGSKLYYDTEIIPDKFTTYFWVKIPSGFKGVIAKFGVNSSDESGMQVVFNGANFGMKYDNYITYGIDATITLNNWTLIGVQYGKVLIKGLGFQEILSMT